MRHQHRAVPRNRIHLVEQETPRYGAQPRAWTAGRGIAVFKRAANVRHTLAAIHRHNFKNRVLTALQLARDNVAASAMFDQVGRRPSQSILGMSP